MTTPGHICPIPYSGFCATGSCWTCPECGAVYFHVCDEADGCFWVTESEWKTGVVNR